MSDSVRPQRWQPTRLPRPWDSPGKNTGVGCHCLLQCMKVKRGSEAAQSCPTLSDPMDCSLPDSSVHGILQARTLEWGAIAFSGSQAWAPSLPPSSLSGSLRSYPVVIYLLFYCWSDDSKIRIGSSCLKPFQSLIHSVSHSLLQ